MKIHFIGIEGVGMRFLAELCKEFALVSGSDLKLKGHDASFVDGADLVVKSQAIGDDNPEIVEAKKQKIPVTDRAELLSFIMSGYKKTIAVAGTHGKTTVSAMLAYALRQLKPTAAIGGGIDGKIGIKGSKNVFIAEACEYKKSFLRMSADIGVILNVEWEHVDCYGTKSEVLQAFKAFADRCKTVFTTKSLKESGIKGKEQTITFGFDCDCDYCGKTENGRLVLYRGGRATDVANLKVSGSYNCFNALAALSVADAIGVKGGEGLSEFCGVDRRMQTLATVNNVTYISDYAHHPTEIECSLSAAKEKHRKTLVVFQPHTYSRTAVFCRSIAAALKKSDYVIVLPVYAAREKFVNGVNDLISEIGNFAKANDFGQARLLIDGVKDVDAVIFMGAGDVNDFAEAYVGKLLSNVDTGAKM